MDEGVSASTSLQALSTKSESLIAVLQRIENAPRPPTSAADWHAVKWWLLTEMTGDMSNSTDNRNFQRCQDCVMGMANDVEAAVSAARNGDEGVAAAAVACWVESLSLLAAFHRVPNDLADSVCRPGELLALPLQGLVRGLVARAAFHFSTWDFNSSSAKLPQPAEPSAPEHMLDFVLSEVAEFASILNSLVVDVRSRVACACVTNEVTSNIMTALTSLFAERFIVPAVTHAAIDAAPLLHLASVVGAFVVEFEADVAPALTISGHAQVVPCAAVFANDADVCATWLSAERQFVQRSVLGERDTAVSALAGAVESAEWRRAHLRESLDMTAAFAAANIDEVALPFSTHLPSALRLTPAALAAQINRASRLFRASVYSATSESLLRAWGLFVDRVVVWCLKWWHDAIDDAGSRCQGLTRIVRTVIAPADFLVTQIRDAVLSPLQNAIEATEPPNTEMGHQAHAIVALVEEELDKLIALRDAALRRCAYLVSRDTGNVGVSKAEVSDARRYCSADMWGLLSQLSESTK
jgi:hypothetical protein